MIRFKTVVMFMVLWAVCSVSGAQAPAGYFRVQGVSSSRIQGFDARAGVMLWENAAAGVTSTVQYSTNILDAAGWSDYARVFVASTNAAVKLTDFSAPSGMVYIPEGLFRMGDAFGEGGVEELPVHEVYVDGFYVDQVPVTYSLWDEVYQWAVTNGYSFDNAGASKAADHPVHTINWWDAVKWCNARSEKEGIVPAYYLSSVKSAASVYRTGQVDIQNDWVLWSGGYRLPTEAEWERAARGGVEGRRFAWGNAIDHSFANYMANGSAYLYDVSPYTTNTYHPVYASGSLPYTSPVGSFAPNTYGVADASGNVVEFCWDRFSSDYYAVSPAINPRGPLTGSGEPVRTGRGGYWGFDAYHARVSARGPVAAGEAWNFQGFRCVLPPQP